MKFWLCLLILLPLNFSKADDSSQDKIFDDYYKEYRCDPSDPDLLANKKTYQDLGCDIMKISQQVDNQEPVAPQVLYHFGEKQYLDEDIQNRGVPEASWNNYVMKSRMGLGPNRVGLYGAVTSHKAENYAQGGNAWMMEIHVKPECRTPDSVVSFNGLYKSPIFMKWWSTKQPSDFSNLIQFSQKCFNSEEKAIISPQGFSDPACEKTVHAFLDDVKPKMIQDTYNEQAWYIRDRSCIKTIRGTPEEIINIFTTQRHLWRSYCNKNQSKAPMMLVLFGALKNIDGKVTDSQLADLMNTLNFSQVPLPKILGPKMITAYMRCRDKNKMDEFKSIQARKLTESGGYSMYYGASDPATYYQQEISSFENACK